MFCKTFAIVSFTMRCDSKSFMPRNGVSPNLWELFVPIYIPKPFPRAAVFGQVQFRSQWRMAIQAPSFKKKQTNRMLLHWKLNMLPGRLTFSSLFSATALAHRCPNGHHVSPLRTLLIKCGEFEECPKTRPTILGKMCSGFAFLAP